MTIDEKPRKKQQRGFALLSPEQRSEMSRIGGIAAHEQGRAHKWTAETGAEAGRKGGAMSRRGKREMAPEDVAALNARIAEQLERGA